MAIDTWEAVLIGVGVLVLLLWFGPGIKESIKNAPRGNREDWKGLLMPVGLVVLLVILLLAMV
jgi:hypothetical protein